MKNQIMILSALFFTMSAAAQTPPASPMEVTAAAAAAAATAAVAAAAAKAEPQDDTHAKLSGTPRLVRENPVPQVFFTDVGDSYYIPASDAYARVMDALNAGLRNRTAVSLVVNKKTRMILDLEGAHVPKSIKVYDDTPEPVAKDKAAPATSTAPDSGR